MQSRRLISRATSRRFMQSAGSRRALHLEIVAIKVVVSLQRFDDQIINRHPDRSAPIRIAPENAGRRFAWIVADAILSPSSVS